MEKHTSSLKEYQLKSLSLSLSVFKSQKDISGIYMVIIDGIADLLGEVDDLESTVKLVE